MSDEPGEMCGECQGSGLCPDCSGEGCEECNDTGECTAAGCEDGTTSLDYDGHLA